MKKWLWRVAVAATAVTVTAGTLSGCSAVGNLMNQINGMTQGSSGGGTQQETDEKIPYQDNGHIVSDEDLDKMDQIAYIVNNAYLYDVDQEGLTDAICAAIMEYLDEPYSYYYDEDSFASLIESTEGTYCGIGASLSQSLDTMKVQIMKCFSNSPALEAGLQDGDYIIGVDDYDISQMELSEIVTYIRGEENTTVHITVYRESTGETLEFDIERRIVEIDTVSYEMLDNKIGYIAIWQFEGMTAKQFNSALEDLQGQGMRSLIVDLRDNPGGVINGAVDVASVFIDGEVVVYTENVNQEQKFYYAEEGVSYEGDVVVLVNGNSASASEILTGALKDYKIATIMGTQTFGKGIVQGVYSLGDGSGLKLTTANYYTPNGNNIHGVGIEPDMIVEADPETEEDEQLTQAMQYLIQLR